MRKICIMIKNLAKAEEIIYQILEKNETEEAIRGEIANVENFHLIFISISLSFRFIEVYCQIDEKKYKIQAYKHGKANPIIIIE